MALNSRFRRRRRLPLNAVSPGKRRRLPALTTGKAEGAPPDAKPPELDSTKMTQEPSKEVLVLEPSPRALESDTTGWIQVYVKDPERTHHQMPVFQSKDGLYVLYFWEVPGTDCGWWVGPAAEGVPGQEIIAFLPYGHSQWLAIVDGVPQKVDLLVADAPMLPPLPVASPLASVALGSAESGLASPGDAQPDSDSKPSSPPRLQKGRRQQVTSSSRRISRVSNSRGDYWVVYYSRELPSSDGSKRYGFQGGRTVWFSISKHGAEEAERMARQHAADGQREAARQTLQLDSDAPKRRRLAGKGSAERMWRPEVIAADASVSDRTRIATLPAELLQSRPAEAALATKIIASPALEGPASLAEAELAEARSRDVSAEAGGTSTADPEATQLATAQPRAEEALEAAETPVLPAEEPLAAFRPVASPARAGLGRRRPSPSRRRSEAGQPPSPPAQAADGSSNPITPSKPRSVTTAVSAEGTETPEMKPSMVRHQDSQPEGRLAAPGLFPGPGQIKLTTFPGKSVIIACKNLAIGESPLLNPAAAAKQDDLLKNLGFVVAITSLGGKATTGEERGDAETGQLQLEVPSSHSLDGPPKKVDRKQQKASEKAEFAMLVKQVTRGVASERPPTPVLGPSRSPWPLPLGPRVALREGPQLGVVS